jgi:oligosaccharide repeat unit polymerase
MFSSESAGSMSFWTVGIFFFLVIYIGFAKSMFRYRINAPVVMGLAWAPALYLSSLGIEFTSPIYQHLSNQNLSLTYVIILISFIFSFLGYALGCRNKPMSRKDFSPNRKLMVLHLLFFVVLSLYAFIILQSNVILAWTRIMLPSEVLEQRTNLHIGAINHFTLGLNFLAANYLVFFIQSKKKVYLVPLLLVFIAHIATLQKSAVLGYVLQILFLITLIMPLKSNHRRLNVSRWLAAVIFGLGLGALLLWTNDIRGIGTNQVTDLHPISEQLFIYSGGAAILNLSATLTGILPSVDLSGLLAVQSFAWILGGRDFFFVTRYLEGINNGTAIMYWWADFGLIGIMLHSTILGFVVGWLQLKARKNMLMLYFSAMSYQFLTMSVFTETLYQPTTVLVVINVIALQMLLNFPMWKSPRKHIPNGTGLGNPDGTGLGNKVNEGNDDRA